MGPKKFLAKNPKKIMPRRGGITTFTKNGFIL
jgi:hypothetical protein